MKPVGTPSLDTVWRLASRLGVEFPIDITAAAEWRPERQSCSASSRNSSGTPPPGPAPAGSRPRSGRTGPGPRPSTCPPPTAPTRRRTRAGAGRPAGIGSSSWIACWMHQVGDRDRQQADLDRLALVPDRLPGQLLGHLGQRQRRRDRTGQRQRPGHRAHPGEAHPHGHGPPGPALGPQPPGDPVGQVAEHLADQLRRRPVAPDRGLGPDRAGPAGGRDPARVLVDGERGQPGPDSVPSSPSSARGRRAGQLADRPDRRARPAAAARPGRRPTSARPAAGRGTAARPRARPRPARRAWRPGTRPWPGAWSGPRRWRSAARPRGAPARRSPAAISAGGPNRWVEPDTSRNASSIEIRSTAGVTACRMSITSSASRWYSEKWPRTNASRGHSRRACQPGHPAVHPERLRLVRRGEHDAAPRRCRRPRWGAPAAPGPAAARPTRRTRPGRHAGWSPRAPCRHLIEHVFERPATGAVENRSISPGCGRAGRRRARRTGSRRRAGRWPRPASAVSAAVRCRSAAPRLVSQLLGRAGAEDRRGDAGPVGDPGQRDLGHRDAAVLGDLLHRVDDVPGALGAAAVPGLHAALGVVAEPGGAGRPLVAPVLARTASRRRAGSTAAAPARRPARPARSPTRSRAPAGCTAAAASPAPARPAPGPGAPALVSCQPVKFDSP